MSLCVAATGLDPSSFDFGDQGHRAQLEGAAALAARSGVSAFLVALRDRGLEAAVRAVEKTPHAGEVALAYAAICASRACLARRRADAWLFTGAFTAEMLGGALDALLAWQTSLNTDAPSATCVAFELQSVYALVADAFRGGASPADMCRGVRRVAALVERQDAAFGRQIRAFRGLYRLARSTRDPVVALELPGSWEAWSARKYRLHDAWEMLGREGDSLCSPLVVTGRVASAHRCTGAAAQDLYAEGARSLLMCGIRPNQGFSCEVTDAEVRVDNALHPDFWLSVPLPELLRRVPEGLLSDELDRRGAKRGAERGAQRGAQRGAKRGAERGAERGAKRARASA
jgi:hypothetical protein